MGAAIPQASVQPAAAGELCARVAALGIAAGHMPQAALLAELDLLRRLAAASGILPAVTVIHAIDSALSRGERGALVDSCLEILADAMASGRSDAQAHEALAAACSVRLSGG